MLSVSPWLRHFPVFNRVYHELEEAFQNVRDFYTQRIERNLQKNDLKAKKAELDNKETSEKNCFLDAFLAQMELNGDGDEICMENNAPFRFFKNLKQKKRKIHNNLYF